MAMTRKLDIPRTFDNLASRQGGSFFLNEDKSYLSYDNGYASSARSLRTNKGLLFKFSIFNYYENKEEVELGLLVNPTDITLGQSFVASNSYTRQGLLSTLWGSQQQTISCAGTSPAFFIGASTSGVGKVFHSGLTTAHRKETLGFINFLSLVAMYKNNGNYFLDGDQNASLFNNKSGYGNRGRVIGVMDSILLSYDGSEYVGSFNAFTLDEDPSRPFNLRYNFEFIVSCMRGDAMDGHLRMRDNDLRTSNEPQIPISVQGRNVALTVTVGMSTKDLNDSLGISSDPWEQSFDDYQKNGRPNTSSDETDTATDGSGGTPGSSGRASTSSGAVTITTDGSTVKSKTGNEIAAAVRDSGAGKRDTSHVGNILTFYDQPAAGRVNQTNAEFILEAASQCHLTLDPVTLLTIQVVEAGGSYSDKGKVSTKIKNPGEGSLGLGQVLPSTYKRLLQNKPHNIEYPAYMDGLGFSAPLTHERCMTDPSYALATTIYLMKSNNGADKGDPVKAVIAYNNYPSLNKTTIAIEAAEYVNTLKEIQGNQKIVSELDKKFKK